MTAPFLLKSGVGPALGRASCHFQNGWHEFVLGILILGEAGLEPSEALAELVEDIGDAAVASLVLADNFGQKLAESAELGLSGSLRSGARETAQNRDGWRSAMLVEADASRHDRDGGSL